MKKTRITALAVVCILLFSCLSLPGFAQEGLSAEQISEKTQFLTALGIYGEADAMEYENENISREELASILSVFYGVTADEYPAETDFADVAQSWSSGHIMTMVNHGLMNGYEDGLFRPNGLVTVEQAIKILVTMTGYDIQAGISGGFPNGYLKVANATGLLKNISFSDTSAAITKGELTALLTNALKVPLLVQTTFGGTDSYERDKEKTLLTDNLNIYYTEGTVKGFSGTSLDYAACAPGHLRIDTTDFLCGLEADIYLGLEVKAYFRQAQEESIGEVLYLETKNPDDVLVIPVEDIVSADLTKVEYNYDDRRTKTVLIPGDVVTVFNGKRLTFFTKEMLKPKMGELRFIDADHDGSYEYLLIEYAVTYFVDEVVHDGDSVTVKDKTGKLSFTIDTVDEEVSYWVFSGVKSVSLTDIPKNSVLSVFADSVDLTKGAVKKDSSFFKLYISSEVVEGTASSKDSETVVIDGVEYPLAGDFAGGDYDVRLGETQSFYLNRLGEVYAADNAASSESSYALLVKQNSGRGLDPVLALRMFTGKGQLLEVTCVDKPVIDGVRKNSRSEAESALKTAARRYAEATGITLPTDSIFQLVKYTLNADGKLKSLDTIVANAESSSDELTYYGTASYSPYYYGGMGCFVPKGVTADRRFGFGEDGIYFSVPGSDLENTDFYTIKTFSEIEDYPPSGLSFFDADDYGVSKICISHAGTTSDSALGDSDDYNLMIIEKFVTKLNSEGSEGYFAKGMRLKTREMIEIEIDSGASLYPAGTTMSDIKPGDFIRWTNNRSNVATMIEKTMSPDGSGKYKAEHGFLKTSRWSYGKALRFNGSVLQQEYNGDNGVITEPCRTAAVGGVYIYNTKKQTLSPGSLSDIKTAEHYGTDADMLGAYYRAGYMNTIIIYR